MVENALGIWKITERILDQPVRISPICDILVRIVFPSSYILRSEMGWFDNENTVVNSIFI